MNSKLADQLLRDEGEVLYAYQDHLGYWGIGVGRLIDKRKGGGITSEESAYLLGHDIDRVRGEVAVALPWTTDLNDARQGVLFAMAFQMGIGGLLGFTNTLALIQAGDFPGAAAGMLQSRWARQTPERAQRLARQMAIGVWV